MRGMGSPARNTSREGSAVLLHGQLASPLEPAYDWHPPPTEPDALQRPRPTVEMGPCFTLPDSAGTSREVHIQK